MNEAQTELELIEPALRAAAWFDTPGCRVFKQFPITAATKPGVKKYVQLKADYVLQYNNQNLAVIEGKARDIDYTDGVGQAKDYAGRLHIRYTYSTNGLKIYGMDMLQAKEGDIDKYPTPDELWQMTFGKTEHSWRDKLMEEPFVLVGGKWQPRYYQQVAISETINAIAQGRDRLLLTMATGTGKTGTAFQICWKLFKAKWNLTANTNNYQQRIPRILFLADRNILADQAFNSFSAFEENALVRIKPSEIAKKKKVPKNGSIFFTIFQTFMSGPNDSPYFGEYPPDFFDFIIIDECHRGGASDESSWREIMDYFSPAVQLGLTATPKRKLNSDTYEYFGEPIYTYSLKQGINDGFLSPFRMKDIDSSIDEYEYDPEDDVEGEIDTDRKYTEEEHNVIIEIMDREEHRVKTLLSLINQKQKTLVFCATQVHAAAIRNLINQHTSVKDSNYCHRVTAKDGKLGEQHLRDFQDNEKSIPTILTTSQKLSTGVDAPEVRNIVLMRPVRTMIEFKQIIGRGTRLYDKKDFFTIYDFIGHKHFEDPEWDGPPLPPEGGSAGPSTPGEQCPVCGHVKCICGDAPLEPCATCGNAPCICEKEPRKMIKVKLSDKKMLSINTSIRTSFWDASGTPITAEQFLQKLFGDLPTFFKNEDVLRELWSKPDTRTKLLDELSEKGYNREQLYELQRLVEGEDSDLFDVLSFVAYHKELVSRSARATKAKIHFDSYNSKQQAFLNFVLEQYVATGVEELDVEKLPDLLELKYKAMADAKKELGDILSIRNTFINFQEFLYQPQAG